MYAKTATVGPPDELNMDVGGTRGLFTTGRCALSMDWGDIGTLAPGTYAQDKTGATITPGWKQVLDRATRQARRLRRDHLPERRRRRQLRAVRLVRRLVRRDQRRITEGEPGRRLRFPVVHERPSTVRHRCDTRQDGLQPVSHLALLEHPAVARCRPEPGGRRELPRRHQVQPREHEHGARHADPADEALPAGRPRHGGLAVPRQASSMPPRRSRPSPTAGTRSPTRPGRTPSSPRTSPALASSGSSVTADPESLTVNGQAPAHSLHRAERSHRSARGVPTARPDGCSSGRPSCSSSSSRSSRSSPRSPSRSRSWPSARAASTSSSSGLANYQQLLVRPRAQPLPRGPEVAVAARAGRSSSGRSS